MGNSAVYRIHTGADLAEAVAMTRRLLALRVVDTCPQEVLASVELGSHDVGRFLVLDGCTVSLTVPVELTEQLHAVVCPLLPDTDRPRRYRDHPWSVVTRLTGPLAAALLQLPPVAADISTPYDPIPSDLPERMLAMVGGERASISWDVCWPGQHNESGFELALNGQQMWHPDTPPGHSVFVHVGPHEPERAHALAAAVGGEVLGPPATGW